MYYEIVSREAVSSFNKSHTFKYLLSTSHCLPLAVISASTDKREMEVSPVFISWLFFEVGKLKVRHSKKTSVPQDVILVIWWSWGCVWGEGDSAAWSWDTLCFLSWYLWEGKHEPWHVMPMTYVPNICRNVTVSIILAEFEDH